MMRYAIDAATLLRIAETDEIPTHQLVAPHTLRSQAMDLLLTEVRSGRMDDQQALRIHQALTQVKVRLLGDRVSRQLAWRLARDHDWPALRDAECIAWRDCRPTP